MSRVDRSAGVDFELTSAEPDPDADEVLVEPPDRAPWFSRRTRLVLTVVAAVAVVTILVVQAVSSGTSSPTASPRASVSVHPSSAPATSSVASGSASKGLARCPKAADGLSRCSTSDLVPAAALTAVGRHFPGAKIDSKVEEDERYRAPGLWFREITASRGRATIVVQIRRHRTTDRTGGYTSETGSGAVLLDELVTGKLTVLVRITTAVGRLPPVPVVQALARDSQLRAPAA